MTMKKQKKIDVDLCIETGKPITSPRSLEACLRNGLTSEDLTPKSWKDFIDRQQKLNDIEKKAAQIRFNHFEANRLHNIELVKCEREKLVAESSTTQPSTTSVSPINASPAASPSKAKSVVNKDGGEKQIASLNNRSTNDSNEEQDAIETVTTSKKQTNCDSTMIALEEKRLDRIKQRQQKEIQALIEMETKMAKLQQENAAREMQEAKKKADWEKEKKKRAAQLAAQKHERELKKLEQDEKEALERRELAIRTAEKEKKMLEEEKEKEKVRQQEKRERELERRLKAEEFHAQTEKRIQAQEEIAMKNRHKMIQREKLVKEKMRLKNEKRIKETAEKRLKADQRIQQALMQNYLAIDERKKVFTAKQAVAYERSREIHKKKIEQIKEKKLLTLKQNESRRERLQQARDLQQQKIKRIVEKRDELESKFEKIYEERCEQHIFTNLEKNLHLDDRRAQVERMQKIEEYSRLEALAKIQESDRRSRELKEKKNNLLMARKKFALESSIRRHQIAKAVDKMRVTNNWTSIDKFMDKEGNNSAILSNENNKPLRQSQSLSVL